MGRALADPAGLLAVWPVTRAAGALPLAMTSSTLLRTRHSAPPQASAATEATLHGAGSPGPAWSLAETSQMQAPVAHACLTAFRDALTTCLPLQSTLHAHPASIRLHHARMHAPIPDTLAAILMTSRRQPPPTLSVVRRRSSRIS